jgi:hypothetical protein
MEVSRKAMCWKGQSNICLMNCKVTELASFLVLATISQTHNIVAKSSAVYF